MPREAVIGTSMDCEQVSGWSPANIEPRLSDQNRAARIALLGELATSIVHEVCQPLSAIEMNAQTSLRWLSRDSPNLETVAQLTARIADSARRAIEIIERVRAMTGKSAPERRPLHLNQMIDEALVFVQHDLDGRGISLTRDLESELPNVFGDRIQIQQVIVNLLVNSTQAIVNAGKNSGRIDISTSFNDEGSARVSIRDNGPGIPPHHLDDIFSGYFSTKPDGMGVGLSICQSIIAAHGGLIGVANHPDGGAVFSFTLPASVGKHLDNEDHSSVPGSSA